MKLWIVSSRFLRFEVAHHIRGNLSDDVGHITAQTFKWMCWSHVLEFLVDVVDVVASALKPLA